jgi:hypothetical protein
LLLEARCPQQLLAASSRKCSLGTRHPPQGLGTGHVACGMWRVLVAACCLLLASLASGLSSARARFGTGTGVLKTNSSNTVLCAYCAAGASSRRFQSSSYGVWPVARACGMCYMLCVISPFLADTRPAGLPVIGVRHPVTQFPRPSASALLAL